jgi:PAS domain S-box-containing protein
MTKVLYLGRERDDGDVVDGLSHAAPHLTVCGASPDAATIPPSVDCVVTTPDATVDGVSVVTALRTAGYAGPVVLFGTGSHESMASRLDELGASTYVRRRVADERAPWWRLAEAVERVTTAESGRHETRLALSHGSGRELLRCEDDATVAAAVVEGVGDVLGVEVAVVEAVASDDGSHDTHVVAATAGFDAELLADPTVTAAMATGSGERTSADDASDDGVVAVVPVGDRMHLLIDGRAVPAVEFDLVETLAATIEAAFDRVRREARLREERDRLTSLFENTSDAIVDVETVDEEPIVRDVNGSFERVFGFAREDVVGRNLDEIVAPTDVPVGNAALGHGLDDGPSEREVRLSTASGVRDFLYRSIPFDEREHRRGYAVFTDVTERKRIERILGRLHETTRTLVRAETTDEIAELTVQAVTDILGYPVTTVRLYDPESEALRLVAVSEGTAAVLGDRPADGPTVDLAWEAFETRTPLVVDDLSAHGITDVGIERAMYLPLGGQGLLTLGSPAAERFDASDRRLAQILAANVGVALSRAARISVLRDREAELARQNERLDAFASVVSHDIRNPLSVARGYLDLARDACDGDEDPSPHFERVERAHERMNRLVTDLLELARQGEAVGATHEVGIGSAARRAWDAVDTGSATLDVVEDRTLRADDERLGTLFENLFRNCVEHGTGDDGTVHVRVGATDDGFFVEDDGPGIPETERETVLDRGYSTSDSGTGFGLSIVGEIVEAHGWAIRVAASDTGGARFEISGVDTRAHGAFE